ncbi:MAG TPA: hypothetical protein IAA58_09355 [Candidatus Gallacutalibacter stercoravium]|nr:hypothetical protein [Candidatus Gallacutalibacter stercoravium]
MTEPVTRVKVTREKDCKLQNPFYRRRVNTTPELCAMSITVFRVKEKGFLTLKVKRQGGTVLYNSTLAGLVPCEGVFILFQC